MSFEEIEAFPACMSITQYLDNLFHLMFDQSARGMRVGDIMDKSEARAMMSGLSIQLMVDVFCPPSPPVSISKSLGNRAK